MGKADSKQVKYKLRYNMKQWSVWERRWRGFQFRWSKKGTLPWWHLSRDLNEGATPTGYRGKNFPGIEKENKDPEKGAYLVCLRTNKEANITKRVWAGRGAVGHQIREMIGAISRRAMVRILDLTVSKLRQGSNMIWFCFCKNTMAALPRSGLLGKGEQELQ